MSISHRVIAALLVVDPPTPSAGMIRPPNGPGLGIELEGAMVDMYMQSSEEYLEESVG